MKSDIEIKQKTAVTVALEIVDHRFGLVFRYPRVGHLHRYCNRIRAWVATSYDATVSDIVFQPEPQLYLDPIQNLIKKQNTMREIELKQKTAVTVALEIAILCDDRQRQLLERDPSKLLVLPGNAIVISAAIKETEIMDDMPNPIFQETIRNRL